MFIHFIQPTADGHLGGGEKKAYQVQESIIFFLSIRNKKKNVYINSDVRIFIYTSMLTFVSIQFQVQITFV